MNFSERMASKLKEARNLAHVSAVDAGNAVGRSDKTIYAWENNKSEPSAEQLISLCKLYGVDISYFYASDLSSESPNSVMTSDESELLRLYRGMSEKNRTTLLDVARAFNVVESE